MTSDTASSGTSSGWEEVADQVIAGRAEARVGVETVRRWARSLPATASILDLGCGAGVPVTEELIEAGFTVYGMDASPAMIAAFRQRFPEAEAACETVQESNFFELKFDAIVAVGLVFLLSEDDQLSLIRKVSTRLEPSGRFLFTSPAPRCVWPDALMGLPSQSLGARAYRAALEAEGFMLMAEYDDEGRNHYYEACKSG